MMDNLKPEWPPLLQAGFWPMSIKDVKSLCVTNFPTSTSRLRIMEGLEKALGLLHDNNISSEVWLDGSFMTAKIDPKDVDMILSINGEIYEKGSEQIISILELFNNSNYLKTHCCDAYLLIIYPDSDDPVLQKDSVKDYNYWLETFGTSRGHNEKGNKSSPGVRKGMAIIRTPFKEDSFKGGLT